MLDKNCTFCKIVDGNISARIISQNDNAIAFLDAFPLSVGHTLVIPKRHYSKTIVGVVLITKDEYHGKPHAGYNEEGYYQGGIPE